jgi:hypothetical protein
LGFRGGAIALSDSEGNNGGLVGVGARFVIFVVEIAVTIFALKIQTRNVRNSLLRNIRTLEIKRNVETEKKTRA